MDATDAADPAAHPRPRPETATDPPCHRRLYNGRPLRPPPVTRAGTWSSVTAHGTPRLALFTLPSQPSRLDLPPVLRLSSASTCPVPHLRLRPVSPRPLLPPRRAPLYPPSRTSIISSTNAPLSNGPQQQQSRRRPHHQEAGGHGRRRPEGRPEAGPEASGEDTEPSPS